LIKKIFYTVPWLWRWVVFVSYVTVIAFASLTPPSNIPKFIYFPNIDKVVHFTMYLGFCILAAWSCDNRRYPVRYGFYSGARTMKSGLPDPSSVVKDGHYSGARKLWIYPLVLILAISWGLLMEIFQRLMAIGRHYSMLDLLANISGALIGIIFYYLVFGRRER